MTDEAKQKDLQEKYMKYQMIEQQMQQLQLQAQKMEEQLVELMVTKQALDDLGKTEPGTEIHAPVSNGIFVKAELKSNETVRLNVGANTIVEKTIPDAKKLIDRQLKEVEKFQQKIAADLQKLALQAQVIQKDLTGLVG